MSTARLRAGGTLPPSNKHSFARKMPILAVSLTCMRMVKTSRLANSITKCSSRHLGRLTTHLRKKIVQTMRMISFGPRKLYHRLEAVGPKSRFEPDRDPRGSDHRDAFRDTRLRDQKTPTQTREQAGRRLPPITHLVRQPATCPLFWRTDSVNSSQCVDMSSTSRMTWKALLQNTILCRQHRACDVGQSSRSRLDRSISHCSQRVSGCSQA
jgi:hypothetical protein